MPATYRFALYAYHLAILSPLPLRDNPSFLSHPSRSGSPRLRQFGLDERNWAASKRSWII